MPGYVEKGEVAWAVAWMVVEVLHTLGLSILVSKFVEEEGPSMVDNLSSMVEKSTT